MSTPSLLVRVLAEASPSDVLPLLNTELARRGQPSVKATQFSNWKSGSCRPGKLSQLLALIRVLGVPDEEERRALVEEHQQCPQRFVDETIKGMVA